METQKIEKSLVPYKKEVGFLLNQADNLTIKTEAEIKIASDVLNRIDEAQKRIKFERDKVVAPAKEIIAWAKGVFSPLLERYDEAERTIKDKMIIYNEKEMLKANKKLKAVADKVAAGKMEIDKASEKIEGLKPAKSYKGEAGAVQFREVKKIVVTNIDKIPRQYMIPDLVVIRGQIIKGIKIPGVEVRIERTVAKGRV